MKRLLAISLLIVHLFNLSGYVFVFRYLRFRSDQQQVQKIEAGHYDRSTLTILKVPMQLPYGNDWAEYERVDGFIELDGIHYTYVERKISRDTVYLACLPNEGKARLKKAETNFAHAVNTIPENQQKEPEIAKKGIFGLEYNDPSYFYQFTSSILVTKTLLSFLVLTTSGGFLSPPFTPPDIA